MAYTSDVGEAARPIVAPKMVTAAYGVSWLYLIGDTGYEGYKARRELIGIPYGAETEQQRGKDCSARAFEEPSANLLIYSAVRSDKYCPESQMEVVGLG